jgi:hypothetical protein
MEHIEQAGIHSGDSACVDPDIFAFREGAARDQHRDQSMARELEVAAQ